MGMIERITEAEAARDLPGILDRVRIEGLTFEIVRGDQVVARLEPAATTEGAPKFGTMDALLDALRKIPPLDPDDSRAFEKDLGDIRREFPMQIREWD